ncbi:YfbK domain-containing protein [Niabella insulamsoli]|uniref:vWA domain-containing protein n=1 Tax=Niabella insulamsoli TaxID=3144874 RepID=UPI0031FC89EE
MKNLKLLGCLFLAATMASFALRTDEVTGKVVDAQQAPVSNATVQEKGSSNVVSTDANGNFSIAISGKTARLIVTAVGYAQKEVEVRAGEKTTIVIGSPAQTLNEVVVVGYGTTHKRAITGGAALLPVTRSASVNNFSRRPAPGAGIKLDRRKADFDREGYDAIEENSFLKVTDNPLSTFSIDVDGASYSNIRRFINEGTLPPAGAVRIEEMINYFTYTYPQPDGDKPFSINTEYTACPWNEKHHLVSIGLQGKKIPVDHLPAANIVFLIDVSGSMSSPDKLPLVQASMKLLADQLRPQDKIAIVVYAGSAGVVLPATDGNAPAKIKDAIDRLQAGGSTAGGAGIELAYKIAAENFVKNGNNRIVLCTDGDFNVGQSSDDELERMIEEKRKTGIFLTVLGFGTGNYQDAKMQKLADKGNGNHAYIDQLGEAKKVLIHQFGGTMFTIAKDVKLQIEFNPAKVQGYRLIGYENRMLASDDFNDDKKDAGEMGSGHSVTALYEIIPAGVDAPELKSVDPLKYQQKKMTGSDFNNSEEVMTVKFRYKKPDGDKSLLLQQTITGQPVSFARSTPNTQLAAGLAQFGMLLRNSAYKGKSNYTSTQQLIATVAEDDKEGYRKELLMLIKKAGTMAAANSEQTKKQRDRSIDFLSYK